MADERYKLSNRGSREDDEDARIYFRKGVDLVTNKLHSWRYSFVKFLLKRFPQTVSETIDKKVSKRVAYIDGKMTKAEEEIEDFNDKCALAVRVVETFERKNQQSTEAYNVLAAQLHDVVGHVGILEGKLEQSAEQIRARDTLVKFLRAATEYHHSQAILSHDLIELVPKPVFYVDRHNRIVSASPSFRKMTGLSQEDLTEGMGEETEKLFGENGEAMVRGTKLVDMVSNTQTAKRFAEVADYLHPESRNDFHYSMGLRFFDGQGNKSKKPYIAHARIAKKPVTLQGEQQWIYNGAIFVLERPSRKMSPAALLSYFSNSQANLMAGKEIDVAQMEQMIRGIVHQRYLSEESDADAYSVLVDFSNTI